MSKPIIRWMAFFVSAMLVVIIAIPGLIVKKTPSPDSPSAAAELKKQAAAAVQTNSDTLIVSVYLTEEHRIEKVPLETYVKGVVAAEMPVSFEIEALKAQAVAARTYIVRRIVEGDHSNMPVAGAWVTDTVAHQAYLSVNKMADIWSGDGNAVKIDKLNKAVNDTRDLIVTYSHKPINALFFSTSNGYTENSEDYWGVYVPYLRSVASPWDERLSPEFKETVSFTYSDMLKRLGISSLLPVSSGGAGIRLLEVSAGHRVKKLSINRSIVSGREVREKLGLRSSQFTWVFHGTKVELTTTGNGHGVGMSQWGADGMALEGKSFKQILSYYYTGVQLGVAKSFIHS